MLCLVFIAFLGIARGDAAAEDSEDGDTQKPEVVVLTSDNFEHLTQAATGATTGDWFVEMYAPWCGHCKRLEPVWNEVAGSVFEKGVSLGKIDMTAHPALQKRFQVKGFPTLIFFKGGKMYRFAGQRTKDSLVAFALGGYKSAASEPVPPPPGVGGGFKELLATLKTDVEGLKKGKVPGPVVLTLISVVAVALVVVLFMMLVGGKETAKAD